MQLTALEAGASNSQLVIDWSSVWQVDADKKAGLCVPIVTLEPDSVLTWSQMVMGQSEAPGYWLQAFAPEEEESPALLSPEERVERFQLMSSPVAQRLMGLVAATPVITLPVIRLVQETLLPKSRQMNVAEVLLGGLLEPINPPLPGENPDQVEYQFIDEAIRDLLLAETPIPDTVRVLSKFIERQFDKSLDEFVTELLIESHKDGELVEKNRYFATVAAGVLKRKGGKYREFVQQIERQSREERGEQDSLLAGGRTAVTPLQNSYLQSATSPELPTVSFPPLQEFEFETAKIVFEEEETQQTQPLEPFEFEMATVEVQQQQRKMLFRLQPEVVIKKQQRQAWGYVERLTEHVQLEMVAIPEGQFQMGSPENEPERYEDESPQHQVSIPEFFTVAKALREVGAVSEALELAQYGLTLPQSNRRHSNWATTYEPPALELGCHELAVWISNLAESLGEGTAALAARIQAFKTQPSFRDYRKAQELAGNWSAVQFDLLNYLRQCQAGWSVQDAKVDIFLDEGLIDDAIASLGNYAGNHLVHRVMTAAIPHQPEWVIKNARSYAEKIMDQGKANAYEEAVEWLKKARAAYTTFRATETMAAIPCAIDGYSWSQV